MLSPARKDRRRIEQPASQEALLRQELPSPRSEWASEPACDRNGEAGLWSFDQLLRHVPIEHLPQQPFALAATHLESVRKAPRKFHHAMIEDRHAHLECDRHARAIDLSEDVVREIGQSVEILHAVERIGQSYGNGGIKDRAP